MHTFSAHKSRESFVSIRYIIAFKFKHSLSKHGIRD